VCVCVCVCETSLGGTFSYPEPNVWGRFFLRGLFMGPWKMYVYLCESLQQYKNLYACVRCMCCSCEIKNGWSSVSSSEACHQWKPAMSWCCCGIEICWLCHVRPVDDSQPSLTQVAQLTHCLSHWTNCVDSQVQDLL